MNQAVREGIFAEAARRNGVTVERLKFLNDNPDQVLSAEGSAVEPRNTNTDVTYPVGDTGRLRIDPLRDSELLSQSNDGLTTSRTYKSGEYQLTSRQMSIERLQSYIPPAEPDMPAINALYEGKVTAQVLLDAGRAETMQQARQMVRKSNKGLLVIAPIPARAVALAEYKRAHPDYDEERGMLQQPTPELYKNGGIRESVFGDNPEADGELPAAVRANVETIQGS